MKKVNLFIVGVAKGGTTSLHSYLDKHPEVSMSRIKEPNYFTWKQIRDQGLYYVKEKNIETESEYLSLFEITENVKILGEASVSYMFYPGTAQKIKAYNPESKVIILLRDPVKRANSHYLMDKRLGFVKKKLSDIFHDPDRENSLHYQQYIKLGQYYSQVKEYLDVFDQKNIRIYLSSEFKTETSRILAEIIEFLGLNGQIEIDTSKQHNVSGQGKNALVRMIYKNRFLRKMIKGILPKSIGEAAKGAAFKSGGDSIDSELEKEIREFYKADILKLEQLIDKNLSSWYE